MFLSKSKKIFTFVIISLFLLCNSYAAQNSRIVKIGYLDGGEFIKYQTRIYSGYCVDYLEEISNYTNWKYEFVQDTWENLQEQLGNGLIDFVFMVHYDEKIANEFLLSSMSIGEELVGVYVNPEADLYYGDYKRLDDMKVGLVNFPVYVEKVDRLETTYNLNVKKQFYQNAAEVKEALKNNEIDFAILGNVFNSPSDEIKLIGLFEYNPYYCMTSKENKPLMDDFISALRRSKIENPEFESSLYRKYYGNYTLSATPLFTREEAEFIESHPPIKVYLYDNNLPMSYHDKSEIKGVYPRYLNLLSEKSGLKFEIEFISPEILTQYIFNSTLKDAISLQYDLNIDVAVEDGKLLKSVPLINTKHHVVKRKKDQNENLSFSVIRKMSYITNLLNDYGYKDIKYYDTAAECLDSVIAGDTTLAILEYHTSDFLFQKPKYADKLEQVDWLGLPVNINFVASPENQMVINILDKAIHHISVMELDSLVSQELLHNPYHMSFADVFYMYRVPIVGILLIIIAFSVALYILLKFVSSTKKKETELSNLREQVQQDELTRCYSRNYFYKKAEELIKQTDKKMCIVFLDITNFKIVNDLYGMKSGDKLLCYIARKIETLCKGRKFALSRFSDDHFFLCISQDDFEAIKFPSVFVNFLKEMEIKVKYGVYVINEDIPVNVMCDRASLPLHSKKNDVGEYIHFYSEDDRQKILHKHDIENNMEKALENKEFCIYIQPKFDVSSEKIVGGEALVRWVKPHNRMVSPGEFIDIFEKNGFIIKLDYYVWEETCKFLKHCKDKALPCPPISINVSRAHFYGKELLEKLQYLIKKYELNPADLELEITESICSESYEIINEKAEELQAAGFKVAMDDFGSGYSSLSALHRLPLDIIKMDMRFMDGKGDQTKSRSIMQSLLELAQKLNLFVVVEGVETADQVNFLRNTGSCCVQGYYYSKPVPSDIFEVMLGENL